MNQQKQSKSNPLIEIFLVAGFQYCSSRNNTQKKNQNQNTINNKKFSILLIDTNNSPCKDLTQVVDSFAMSMFYKKFLDWTRNDQTINLIIKPKKLLFLENINGILKSLKI